MGIEDSNQGPGWNDHDTPYGPIHSYDGNSGSSSYGGGSGGNGGNRHDGITDKTTINIATTKDYDGRYMTMCANNLKAHEGFKNSMYKDTGGHITVGIGHMLSSAEMAAGLPFTRTKTTHAHGDDMEHEEAVSKADITSAFNNFTKDSKSIPANLHLSNDDVIGQCIKDVQTAEKGLRGLYSGYDNFPNEGKTALVDMAFNLGISKLRNGFPNFNAAINRNDWNGAADESHRTGIGDKRNSDTKAQLQQAGKKK